MMRDLTLLRQGEMSGNVCNVIEKMTWLVKVIGAKIRRIYGVWTSSLLSYYYLAEDHSASPAELRQRRFIVSG